MLKAVIVSGGTLLVANATTGNTTIDVLLAVQHGKDEVAVRPAQIPHGDVLVVTAQQSGSSVLVLGVVGRGPVPSCVGNPGNLPGKSDLGSPPSR